MRAVERLRELMEQGGLSQRRLGFLCSEVDPHGGDAERWRQYLWRWLDGRNEPSMEMLEVVAAALKVSADEFRPAQITQAELDELLAELAALRRRAAETDQQNAELRQQLERMERLGRRPQELLKPNAQRKAGGR